MRPKTAAWRSSCKPAESIISDQRDDDLEPTTTPAIDAEGGPIDPNQIHAPQSSPMDDAAGGPAVTPEKVGVAAQLGDFA